MADPQVKSMEHASLERSTTESVEAALHTDAIKGLAADLIDCPLCIGRGQLSRAEVLERLDMKDFARVAQLSAEQAFAMLLKKQKEDEARSWSNFETELTKRTAELTQKHTSDVQALQTE